jgi:uncharacterized protein (DUF2141 family)
MSALKNIISLFAVLIFAICVSDTVLAGDAQTSSITVVMTGFKSDAGKVRVALVKDKDGFDSETKEPFSGAAVDIKGGVATHVFKNVPYGEYAVKFFHDEDGSGKLKTGVFGIPKEEYGFSNDTSSKNFSKAKFQVNDPTMTLELKAR